MSSVKTNTSNGIEILIQFENVIFTSTELLKFDFYNKLNTKPQGEFVIVDRNSDLIIQKSADYGTMYITNTSDTNKNKAIGLSFIIDEMTQLENESNNTSYLVKWSAGNRSAIQKETKAFKGTSMEALLDICKSRDHTAVEQMSGLDYETPSDTMTWRYIQDDMWESLSTVVDKSYYKNDYLFWVYDDVNSVIKVSSLGFEKKIEDTNLLIYSDNSQASTEEVKKKLTKPNMTVWSYGESTRDNELGKNRSKLFPNVSFSGVRDTEIKQAALKTACFSGVLKSMGDDKQEEIKRVTGLDSDDDVFGDLEVRRNWPNNVHKMYSFADTYRDYKISTFGKVMYVKVYNTIGPVMGSKASVVALGNSHKVKGNNLDETYTDSYILVEKMFRYSTHRATSTAEIKSSGNAMFVTTLKYVSDNLENTGFEDVINILNQIESVTDGKA